MPQRALVELARTRHEPLRRRALGRPARGRADRLLDLQRSAGNRAVTVLVQRDRARNPLDPVGFSTFGDWLAALPSGAVDDKALDITGEVGKKLPDLSSLVVDLKADCADVTILLKHYYYGAHGKTIKIPAQTDTRPRKRISFPIGAGVDRKQLRMALVNLGTVHFQDMRKADRIISYYGGPKPLTNLAAIMKAGLEPGDVLVWKKLEGIKGNFSGHIQTVQHIWSSVPEGGSLWEIEVLQGTMESGKAVGQIQSKKLSSFLLTGRYQGDGPITYRPNNEEKFFGAGKW
jgi:hypothetical protein